MYYGEEDTPEHTIFYCARWHKDRIELQYPIAIEVESDNIIQTIISKRTNWDRIQVHISKIITTKEKEDHEKVLAKEIAEPLNKRHTLDT